MNWPRGLDTCPKSPDSAVVNLDLFHGTQWFPVVCGRPASKLEAFREADVGQAWTVLRGRQRRLGGSVVK